MTSAITATEPAPAVRLRRAGVRIGGVLLASPDDSLGERFREDLQHFEAGTWNTADIEVSVKWSQQVRPWPERPSFDSGAVWKLFSGKSHFVFDFSSPLLAAAPYKRMRVSHDFRHAQITLNRELLRDLPVSPLEYPTDELLITNYLAMRGLGVEVHGCGLIDSETGGHLFLGHSGAGKSTTARMWQSLRNPEILSDDRVILRLHQGELWMFGTPWHGEASFASPGKAKIDRIFILEHGERNRFVSLPKARAVGELFARCFPPFHSAAALDCTVEFLSRVVETVPCYEFSFIPNGGAVELVLGLRGDRRQ